MLSAKIIQRYKEELILIGSQGKMMRLANANLESKLKQKKFLEEYGIFAANEKDFIDSFKWNSNVVTFLLVISKFESILYKICCDHNKKVIGIIKTQHKDRFLDVFVGFKEDKVFIPFAFTKNIYEKTSQVDLEYLKDLICVRNYFAHGEKTTSLLEKADKNIINDLETIINKLCLLIEQLEE